MAALTGEIYILAPRYQLVSGHGTTCPYDTPLKVTTITKPIATTKSQSGRYVCFANSIYCLTAIRYVAEATRYAPAVREFNTTAQLNRIPPKTKLCLTLAI